MDVWAEYPLTDASLNIVAFSAAVVVMILVTITAAIASIRMVGFVRLRFFDGNDD